MKALRCSGLIAITLLLAILLAACGDTTTQGTPANPASQGKSNGNTTNTQKDGGMMYATPTANMNNSNTNKNNGTMMGGITITPTMGGNMAAFIHTGKAAINGKQVNVLVTKKGFAVYYYKADSMFTATCSCQCIRLPTELKCSTMAMRCIPTRRMRSLVSLQVALRTCNGTW